ncbi:MAG TPA: thiamine-phosphate kinase [Rhodanobacteraceae bacterium]|nr:thiamine-phosphate kinase [Rhodanobacteraceae bacterium]
MEFDLIEAIRARVNIRRGDVALGIGDDATLLDVPADRQLVACTDTLVAGVHFLVDTSAVDIGWKALAVNLSDLAAMGAEPAWALLALTMPEADDGFVDHFAEGFAELAGRHGVALVGGDTTQGPLSMTVTMLGTVPRGQALTRGGARAGDTIFVTGTLGDAAGALRLLRDPGESHPPRSPFLRKGEGKRYPLPPEGAERMRTRAKRDRAAAGGCAAGRERRVQRDATVELVARMHRPEPRIAAGLALRDVASACIDVSDGLLADLGHVCASSRTGADIDVDALPVSPALAEMFGHDVCRTLALTGGDDYELCFSVPEDHAVEVGTRLAGAGCVATRIGRMTEGGGVRVADARGNVVETPHAGWEHFSR